MRKKSRVQADVSRGNIRLRRERGGDRLDFDIPTGDNPERFAMILVELPNGPTPGVLRNVKVGGVPVTVHAWHLGGDTAATEHAAEQDEHEHGLSMGGRFFAVEMTSAEADEISHDEIKTWREKYTGVPSLDGSKIVLRLAPIEGDNHNASNPNLLYEGDAQAIIAAVTWPRLLTWLGYVDLLNTADYTEVV